MIQSWRAYSALASDPAFFEQIEALANCISNPDLVMTPVQRAGLTRRLQRELPDLEFQPDFGAIAKIQAAFRARDIVLSVYEACEINRLFFVHQRGSGNMASLAKYWQALGAYAQQRKNDLEFMAIAGALAIDTEFRFDFASNHATLSSIGFPVSPAEEEVIRGLVQNNGQADLAARAFRDDSWSGSCLTIARPYPGWVTFNV